MGQGQSGGLPSKQGGTRDRKGNANNKEKYEPGTADPRGQEAAETEGTRSSRRSRER
jgi:hypothetical protein